MKLVAALGVILLLFIAVHVPPIAVASLVHHFAHKSKDDVVPIVVGGVFAVAILAIYCFVRFGGMTFAEFGFRASRMRYLVWALVLGIPFGVLTEFGAKWVHDSDPSKMAG